MLLLAMTGAEMIGDADAGRSLLARATKNCRLENSLNALEDTLCRLRFAKPDRQRELRERDRS